MGILELNSDNEPVPENVLISIDTERNDCAYGVWGHGSGYFLEMKNVGDAMVFIYLPSKIAPGLADIFGYFHIHYITDIMLVAVNKNE
jgi:hypothetical protein